MFLPADFYKDPQNIGLIFFVIITLIQLFYFWFYYARVAFYKNKDSGANTDVIPVSVIICAKNEYNNLDNFLPLILEQDYPDYEVILVNDLSQDDSYFLLKSFEEKYNHFKVIHLRENVNFFEGKKLALALGIKSAKNEIVLLTDADCKPVSKNWISHMSSGFTENKSIVLGYGGYNSTPGFLNKLVRYDTLTIAMQYMGMALAGSPYMGVGRNLAYRKAIFFKTGGFASHYKIKSGDDDLFVNKAANSINTAVVLNPDSFTFSETKRTFASWFRQKKRHLSTGIYYKFADKFRLGLLSISNSLFYISLVISLIISQSPIFLSVTLGLFTIRTFSLVLLYYNAGNKLMERKLFLYSPIFDVIMVILNPIFALSNLFYRKNKWK